MNVQTESGRNPGVEVWIRVKAIRFIFDPSDAGFVPGGKLSSPSVYKRYDVLQTQVSSECPRKLQVLDVQFVWFVLV